MEPNRDIYKKPGSESKEEKDLPSVDITPMDFRARTWRNTLGFVALMLALLGLATWIIYWQELRRERAVAEPGSPDLTMLSSLAALTNPPPFVMPGNVSIPDVVEPGGKTALTEPEQVDKMKQAMAEVRLGQQYLLAHEWDKAEEHARKALEIWPDMNVALRMLGVVYLQRGQFDQSLVITEKALKDNPFDAEAINTMASAYIQKGMLDKAEELLNTSLELQPNYLMAQLNMGLLYLMQGRYDAAVEFLEPAVEKVPNDPAPRNNLAVALFRVGRFDDGRRHLQHIIDRNPNIPNSYFNLAISYAQEKKFPEAMEWIRLGAKRCSPVACQRFLADTDFDAMRGYPDYEKFLKGLYPDVPKPPSR